jgi:hypothetical protein
VTTILRRLLAALLLLAPAFESGAALMIVSSSAHAGCAGHVCFCPPRAAAREACHGGAEHDSTALTGACHHDTTNPVLAATTPFLLSTAPALPGTEETGPAPLARAQHVARGHLRIPLLPPRTA